MTQLLRRFGLWLRDNGFPEDAEPMLTERLAILRGLEDPDREELASGLIDVGVARLMIGRAAEAEPALRESLAIRQEVLPEESWLIASSKSALGDCLRALGQLEDAERLLLEAVIHLDASAAPQERRREARERLVRLYEAWERPEDAERWR